MVSAISVLAFGGVIDHAFEFFFAVYESFAAAFGPEILAIHASRF
jgi:hypothetical protein